MNNRHFTFGKLVAGADSELDRAGVHALEGYVSVLDSVEGESVKRDMCKLAALAFEADDAGNTAHAHLFRNLANAPTWYPEFDKFTDCVARAVTKQANPIIPAAAVAANDKLGGMVSKLLSLGALGGIGAGGIGFLMARDARQTSAENAALLEKIRAYKQLKRDLEEDMAHREILAKKPTKKSVRYDV